MAGYNGFSMSNNADAANEYEKVFGNGTSWKLKRIID